MADQTWNELFELVQNLVRVRQRNPTQTNPWANSRTEVEATKEYDSTFSPDATPAVVDATWSHNVPESASSLSEFSELRSMVGDDDRTLFVKIHVEHYSISHEVLHQVFSKIGNLESIDKFGHGAQYHSRVRFQERGLAVKALECYDGRCIYDGCCLMELSLKVPISSRLSKIEAPVENSIQAIAPSMVVQDIDDESAKVLSSTLAQNVVEITMTEHVVCDATLVGSKEMDADVFDSLLGSVSVAFDYAPFPVPIDSPSIENFNVHPSLIVDHPGPKILELMVMKQPFINAQVMFEKMSEKEVGVGDESIKLLRTLRTVFGSIDTIGFFVFDPGKNNEFLFQFGRVDEGGARQRIRSCRGCSKRDMSAIREFVICF